MKIKKLIKHIKEFQWPIIALLLIIISWVLMLTKISIKLFYPCLVASLIISTTGLIKSYYEMRKSRKRLKELDDKFEKQLNEFYKDLEKYKEKTID